MNWLVAFCKAVLTVFIVGATVVFILLGPLTVLLRVAMILVLVGLTIFYFDNYDD